MAVGGSGGDGNSAGAVEIDNAADIFTHGAQSHGIFAQSIGGGGGSGGRSAALSLSTSDLMPWKEMQGDNWGLDLSVGGSGGDGNTGDTVSVINRGQILTEGALSRGIVAQSIGGGGGSGAQGILGTGVDWLDDALGALSPLQMAFELKGIIEDPTELLPKSASISVGGSGGDSGHADAVRVENFGDIATRGFSSHAIFAQSIGGGGGEAQLYARGQGEGAEAAVGIGLLGEIAVGGAGGVAGDGADVDILHAGNIWTQGEAASGIFAQSIGGGGGQAGSITGGFADITSIGLGLAFGRDGGSAGDGGAVTVTSAGEIVTSGEAAVAVFAQSIGGGGGIIGDVGGMAFAGSVGGYGSGGAVSVHHDGVILTSGAAAHGIMAQSVGGVDNDVYEGDGGPVSVSIDGHIHVEGIDATAILAQSLGGGSGGQGNIYILVEDGGTVLGGSGAGAGVRLLDGADNQLINHGTVTTFGGIDGQAITATGGNDTIHNHGRIIGSVDLGEGVNAFNNLQGGLLDAGTQIQLGAGNTLTNAGTLSPGGSGMPLTTTLSGQLVQESSGALALDMSMAGLESDHLSVSGSAHLQGSLGLKPIDTGYARPGANQQVLVSAAGGVVTDEFTLSAPASAVASYALFFPSANEVGVSAGINFSPTGLGPNARRIGEHVNAIQLAGGSESFAPFAAGLFAQPDEGRLDTAYEKLSPGIIGSIMELSEIASTALNNAMHSCRQREGEYRFVREGECGWIRVGGARRDQQRTDRNPGYRLDTLTIAGGRQREVQPDLHLGFGISYQRSKLDSRFSNVDGDLFEAGMMIKRRLDATRISGSLSAGYGRYESLRRIDLSGIDQYARGTPSLWSVSAHGRFSHDVHHRDDAYVRPMVSIGATRISRSGFRESGAGGASLDVDSASDTIVTLQPAIETGGEWEWRDGSLLRPYMRVGVTQLLTGNEHKTTAKMLGAPDGVAPFTVTNRVDRTYGDVVLGLDLIRDDGRVWRFDYAGQFSDNSRSNAVSLRFSMPF
ncbi:hypothetical protein B1C78_16055 [Thioalkalivibrio denitrificans]|uniref:Autotransporter domain-containing protein n=1 Tax=Thioalkalivibrio denitrificans TaxID=108003 RepID=A0A1V3N8Q1_9GAMM|nr:hypothetical protein B1C78_16055 [Thioalkalivibrio denitrificans]